MTVAIKIFPFFGADHCFSNWHMSRFVVKNIEFNCVEQYMMYCKAKLFGDEEVASLIMKSKSPKIQKMLGRKVANYDEAIWSARRRGIVSVGIREKFKQNPDFLEVLFSTGKDVLVEASPWDRVWGVGLDARDDRINNPLKWQGQNLLGKILMEIRSRIETIMFTTEIEQCPRTGRDKQVVVGAHNIDTGKAVIVSDGEIEYFIKHANAYWDECSGAYLSHRLD